MGLPGGAMTMAVVRHRDFSAPLMMLSFSVVTTVME